MDFPYFDPPFLPPWMSDSGGRDSGTGAKRTAGLSKVEIGYMQGNWSHNMKACQAAIVEKDGFNWQLFKGRACLQPTDSGVLTGTRRILEPGAFS